MSFTSTSAQQDHPTMTSAIAPPPPYTAVPQPQAQHSSNDAALSAFAAWAFNAGLTANAHTNLNDSTSSGIYSSMGDDNEDADPEDAKESSETDTIDIDASTAISGTANIITADILDAATLSGCRAAGALYAALNKRRVDAGNAHARASMGADAQATQRPLKIRLTCGVRVLGSRNIVGCGAGSMSRAPMVLRPAAPSAGKAGEMPTCAQRTAATRGRAPMSAPSPATTQDVAQTQAVGGGEATRPCQKLKRKAGAGDGEDEAKAAAVPYKAVKMEVDIEGE